MRVRGPAPLLAVLLLLLACGDPRRVGEPADSLGWSELASAPYGPELLSTSSFWATGQAVVFGGYISDSVSVTFSAATYLYDLVTNRWSESSPLQIEGYDGVIAGDGVWSGQAWTGWIIPCRSGPLITDEVAENCDSRPMAARWSLTEGWAVSALADTAFRTDDFLVWTSGTVGTFGVLATNAGFTLVDAERPGAPRFVSWPEGAAPYDPHATCVLNGAIVTINSSSGPLIDQPVNDQPAQSLTANVVSLEGALIRRFAVLDVRSQPPFPFCHPAYGLFLDGQAFAVALRVVTDTGVRELPDAPVTATGDLEQPIAGVRSSWIPVDTGIASLSTLGLSSFYLDANTGVTIALQPVPELKPGLLWTGDAILAQLNISNRWFIFVPGPWQGSGALPPPRIG